MNSYLEKQLQFIEDYKKSSNAATGSKYDSNANVVDKNIATLATELDKKAHIDLQRAVMKEYLTKMGGEELAKQYEKDLAHHIIYRHDETTGAGGFPYCVSMSLYPFINEGLTKVGGSSLAPQHADSFIGGFVNLLYIVAAQYSGAIAVSETLTYFDHFLRKDYGDDYYLHLDKTVEIRKNKEVSLRERIENWFAQLVYTINQPAAARGNQSIFFNIAYFDKYYFESIFEDFIFPDGDEPCWESTSALQKMFMEWLNNERLKNIITFPVETVNLYVENGEYKDKETADWAAEMWAKGASFFMYQSDSVDALASCCFHKDQKVLVKGAGDEIIFDTIENVCNKYKGNIRIYNNGSWKSGKRVETKARTMYKITTENNKEIIVSDNHLNPCYDGTKKTTQLNVGDYLLFFNQRLKINTKDKPDDFKNGAIMGGSVYIKNALEAFERLEWSKGLIAYDKKDIMNTIHFTPSCLKESEAFRAGVLQGLNITGNFFCTDSKAMIESIDYLAMSLGKYTTITYDIKHCDHNFKYCIEWYDAAESSLSIVDDFDNVYFKIKSIERIDYNNLYIYCFEMEDKNEPYFTLPNGIITHNCRLRNAIEDREPFSYTLGAGGIMTGSKAVITLNVNRIIQDWAREESEISLEDYLSPIVGRVHKYLEAFNNKIWDDYNAGLLTIYKAGFIELDKQFLTVGVQSFLEGAEFLGIEPKYDNSKYREYAQIILGTIEKLNKLHRSEHCKYNLEVVPGESLGAKFAKWDKEDGYESPREIYNSYFYPVEADISALDRFFYQGEGYADICSGGVALHNNLEDHLSAEQYRKLMDIAVLAGCNYFTYNIPNTICNECGYISKHMLDECPKCHSHNLDYATRIVGYLKRISNFSEVRQREAAKRHYSK